jgi:endonuclease/exonuclease/phosphatase family metal-dependent hydrolase
MRLALEEATMDINGRKVTVFIGHLGLLRKTRLKQLAFITNIIKTRTGPIIFAGDSNEKDPAIFDELRAETALKQLYTKKSFPSWKPRTSLDYILLSEDFKVNDFYMQKEPAYSDHLSLIVKAELN